MRYYILMVPPEANNFRVKSLVGGQLQTSAYAHANIPSQYTYPHTGIYLQSLESELSSCRHELEESQSKMEELERTLDDKQEAVRVVEKKSQNMVSQIITIGSLWYMYMYHAPL
jgi:folylpolyglutamate synthase/dihydropteroate synthase